LNPAEEVPIKYAVIVAESAATDIVGLEIKATPLKTAIEVPPPEAGGAAHVPSPRQKVDALAFVPEFRFATGRFPNV
jgi:hypothetical protein